MDKSKEKLIKKYFNSSLTQRAFAEQAGIKLPTFQRWLYIDRKNKPEKPIQNFIPLNINSSATSPAPEKAEVTIEFPNGLKLRIS